MNNLIQAISCELEKNSYKMRIVPVEHLQDLQAGYLRAAPARSL